MDGCMQKVEVNGSAFRRRSVMGYVPEGSTLGPVLMLSSMWD